MQFGLAHNGNLTNAESIKQELEQRGAIFSSTSDSEILAHLIRRSRRSTKKADAPAEAAENVAEEAKAE